MRDAGVLVMAKAPRAGFTKTRLCPPCTPDQAADIASAALRDTLVAAQSCRGRKVTLALDGEPGAWVPPGVRVVPQRGATFNERLANAWAWLPDGGVQIGMDTPQVSAGLLECAIAAVTRHGAALGPATDGGWWLIGLERPDPSVFDLVPMSTPETYAQQLARMHRIGLRPQILPVLTDIDTWAAALEVASGIPRSRTASVVANVASSLETAS